MVGSTTVAVAVFVEDEDFSLVRLSHPSVDANYSRWFGHRQDLASGGTERLVRPTHSIRFVRYKQDPLHMLGIRSTGALVKERCTLCFLLLGSLRLTSVKGLPFKPARVDPHQVNRHAFQKRDGYTYLYLCDVEPL